MAASEQKVRRIGVLTGGGDAPGLNAVIRAVVKAAASRNCEVIGLEDSFDGLIEANRSRRLVHRSDYPINSRNAPDRRSRSPVVE